MTEGDKMLLAADVGNSNIVLGLYDGDRWRHIWRLSTKKFLQEEEYLDFLKEKMRTSDMEREKIEQVVVSSVVPEITGTLMNSLEKYFEVTPILLTADSDSVIGLDTEQPEKVGTDLIAGATAAYSRFRATCIVVDFGTATTVMVVEEPGVLTGGAICAGLEVSAEALVGKASQLSAIPLELPPNLIARNTVEAMQTGLVLGHICMVEGIVERFKKEIGSAKVIATGGLSEMLSRHTDIFDAVDPVLTLNGLLVVAESSR